MTIETLRTFMKSPEFLAKMPEMQAEIAKEIQDYKDKLKKLRREKRKNYDKWYYENKTKVKRKSPQTLSNK